MLSKYVLIGRSYVDLIVLIRRFGLFNIELLYVICDAGFSRVPSKRDIDFEAVIELDILLLAVFTNLMLSRLRRIVFDAAFVAIVDVVVGLLSLNL